MYRALGRVLNTQKTYKNNSCYGYHHSKIYKIVSKEKSEFCSTSLDARDTALNMKGIFQFLWEKWLWNMEKQWVKYISKILKLSTSRMGKKKEYMSVNDTIEK